MISVREVQRLQIAAAAAAVKLKGKYDTNKSNACTKLWLKKGSYASHLSHKLSIIVFAKLH